MYFVTLNHPNGGVVPMVDEDGEVTTFGSYTDALVAIKDNMLGHAYGGRVYNTGEDGTDV